MKSLLVMLGMVFALVSCADDKGTGTGTGDGGSSANRAIVEAQVREDFGSSATIGAFEMTEKRGYQVATFTLTFARSTTTKTTAWYKIADAKATLTKDVMALGVTMPADLDTVFKATPKYSEATLWTVTEVEKDTQHTNNNSITVYEVELVNKANPKLEAELYYNTVAPIKLLYSKETLDADDNEDKVVVDDALTTAVKTVYPAPATIQIIDAEMEDNNVEVEALITSNTPATEIEIVFTVSGTTYTVVSQEVETTLDRVAPAKLKEAIDLWVTANTAVALEGTDVPANAETSVKETKTGTAEAPIITYEVEIEYSVTTPAPKDYEIELTISYEATAYTVKTAKVNDVVVP